ncbi:DNA (cytosine-5)-methyltransferase 1 [Ereboglobus sp. PH5-10]|uniref:DNA cytosine methyltransferase n=1 Tax=Ereboglobus sp. PH5-10 TaxID=2940629 RepID=UPI002405EA8A|nr:DNA cytosine methyltransferase [Ereboglobus sp. PH5-10]MDF9828221.1 DNA (cytosine-5)-methyltransferase 1 [Ereboglobus sp. PH5-10]
MANPASYSAPKKHSQLTCIDLFAGCGGLSLGLEQAGFRPLLFSEINISAAETYIINRPGLNLVPVGDIYNLTDPDLELLKIYWRTKGIDDVDLVAGGPPCQGYSGIGHRRTFKLDKKEIPSNHLYEEMVRVIRVIRPRIFLFENVKGLLSAKWDKSGKNGEIFKDVLRSFKTLGEYHIRWDLLHAKDYGVPQNRPRVLMVGIRNDVLYPTCQGMLFEEPELRYDLPSAVREGFLPAPNGTPPTLPELLGDLEDPNYGKTLVTRLYPSAPKTEIQKELRTCNGRVLGRREEVSEQEYSDHAGYIREKYAHMIANNGEIPDEYKTKKFAQRVFPKKWDSDGPNITATSLPEDYVHYSQPRTPTVREWARIQTFPDWYQFAGPRTTGGRRRAGDPGKGIWERDVPKYTQIGNAVPVMLARKVGQHLARITREGIRAK